MNQRIQELKEGNVKTIENLYHEYKSGFMLFLNKYGLSDEDAIDIYQDAMVALVENAKKGNLDDLKVELKTYLFSIGKYMAFKRLKKEVEAPEIDWYNHTESEGDDEMITAMQKGLKKLGTRCYEILRLFYYEEKKLDEIQEILRYDKKEVLKSQKSRCLKQLKDILHERLD